ncbi:A disintegrin and metalloproteinase with thrombospondin motifs 20-like isoform X2 [Oscarella lobularis]|uniref:A disintegrin and metalloproteinase with thrombospondin motifs 20-like isoform X2 n=1 Tax=Oscarella lobularis TaxID=121494 RepID=UPI0033138DD6
MGFFGAYFGVLMCFHWLAAGQQRYSRCVDYYKTGSTIDGQYDLEILPRIVVSVYCKDMNTGEPSEYISLNSSRERNYASYDKLLGCPPTVLQRIWDEWGKTHFTLIRFDFDSWLVTTNDFSFAASVEDGSNIPYGQGGDNQTTLTCPFRGNFNIDLTSTPFQVDPQVTWSWEGPMSNNHSVSFSNLRQIVSGRCGGFPGICFPVLPSNRSIARLKLRLVSTHPCLTKNPCQNLQE